MRLTASILPRLALALSMAACMASDSLAQTAVNDLLDPVAEVEQRLGARVGVSLTDTGSDLAWANRSDERFLMNSTFKAPLCGAVLARRDAGNLSLSDELPVREADLLLYAPITQTHVGETMTIDELCLAAIDMSDNAAANLLIDRLGGPEAVTQFFRETGDETSRLDRREPDLNTFVPNDPRDTTTPAAMAETLRKLLLGDGLPPPSRAQLTQWMSLGGVTSNLLRTYALESWRIYDKSGGGSHTRNIIAVVDPDGRDPWVVAIFISDTNADFDVRNAALQEIGKAVVAVIRE